MNYRKSTQPTFFTIDEITKDNLSMPSHVLSTCTTKSMTLTVPQMAEELNISRATAYALTKQDGFPCFHIGKRILIDRELLQQWIDHQCDTLPAV